MINPDKSNSILFATTQWAQLLPNQVSINISGVSIALSNHVKIRAAVLDPRITLSEHTKAVSKSCFYHIHTLRHIRGSLDHWTIRTIAAALDSTRFDYANSILHGIPAKHISRLQCTENTLACVVTGKRYIDSSPSILKELTGRPSTLASSLKLPRSPLKLLIPVILHILPACSTSTPHVEPFDPPQPISCLSCDVTCHLVLVVSIQVVLPSGIVSQLTSVLV